METRYVGRHGHALQRGTVFVLILLETLENICKSDIHCDFNKLGARRISGSMSDATNTAIRLVNVAALQARGILNHVRARGSYIIGCFSIIVLSDVTVSYSFRFIRLIAKKYKLRWQIQQQHRQ